MSGAMDHEAELDRRILAEVAQGSEAAFVRFVDRYQRRIYTLAVRILGDPEDAADMSQEIFLKIYKAAARFRGASSVSTWVYRITLNTCLNRKAWWKRRRRDRWVSLETSAHADAPSPLERLAHPWEGPDRAAERSEFRILFQAALRKLPPEFRAAVVLRDQEGLSYEEIASLLSVSIGTVKSRISRGRGLLRRHLGPVLRPEEGGGE